MARIQYLDPTGGNALHWEIRSFFRRGPSIGVRVGGTRRAHCPTLSMNRSGARDFYRARHLVADVDAATHTSPEPGRLNVCPPILKKLGRKQFTARETCRGHTPIKDPVEVGHGQRRAKKPAASPPSRNPGEDRAKWGDRPPCSSFASRKNGRRRIHQMWMFPTHGNFPMVKRRAGNRPRSDENIIFPSREIR